MRSRPGKSTGSASAAARLTTPRIPAQEIIEAIHDGTIKGLLSICFNPAVSSPDSNFTAEALDKLEFYSVIDFFLSESAHHADVVLPGSLHEEDEGTSTSGEGRIIKINAAVTPPGEARLDWEILLEVAERLGGQVGTVKSRVSRARGRLAELLGYDEEDLSSDRLIQSAMPKDA